VHVPNDYFFCWFPVTFKFILALLRSAQISISTSGGYKLYSPYTMKIKPEPAYSISNGQMAQLLLCPLEHLLQE